MTDVSKAFVVLNPVAGNSEPEKLRAWLVEQSRQAGWQYEIYETTGKEDLPALVREAIQHGSDLVVAVGGDGTVSGVASGCVAARGRPARQVPMAIVPLGTGNAMARALDVPLDLEEALALAFGPHRVRRIDVMRVRERVFLANVTVGLSARMIEEANSEEKQRFGLLAYVAAALTVSFQAEDDDRQARPFVLAIDGQPHQVQASQILVFNTGVLGLPNVDLGLGVRLDDGQIDVYVVPADGLADSVLQMLKLLAGGDDGGTNILHLMARHAVSIEAENAAPVQADGELLGKTPVKIQVVPAAVAVVVPDDD